uniref:Peptidase S1 domain-containing protein n=2 Tax=Equus caballus TaxID=9796 RepID=A0A9L0RH93_HORSE
MQPLLLLLVFLLPPEAGTENIIGGHEAKPHSHPYTVFVQFLLENKKKRCGGVLVLEDFVLTAAHCRGRLALSKHLLPIMLFLLRKTGPDLTLVPFFLYFICGLPATAWLDKPCVGPHPGYNPGSRSRTCELNHCTTRPAPRMHSVKDSVACKQHH